ncbi:MAG: IS110 family transposase [Acidobacteriaceae bacterium]|nr:IS110 family transposase [Acidobacteriaceae bacterium]
MLSLPGLGIQTATTLLAEAGQLLAAKDSAGLRAYSGVAPVTKQSGKTKRVQMRNGCNQRVREACYHWARVSVQRDEHTRQHYQQLRDAGHGHGRALRGVCDRLLSVLIGILRSGLPYDPNRYRKGYSLSAACVS